MRGGRSEMALLYHSRPKKVEGKHEPRRSRHQVTMIGFIPILFERVARLHKRATRETEGSSACGFMACSYRRGESHPLQRGKSELTYRKSWHEGKL